MPPAKAGAGYRSFERKCSKSRAWSGRSHSVRSNFALEHAVKNRIPLFFTACSNNRCGKCSFLIAGLRIGDMIRKQGDSTGFASARGEKRKRGRGQAGKRGCRKGSGGRPSQARRQGACGDELAPSPLPAKPHGQRIVRPMTRPASSSARTAFASASARRRLGSGSGGPLRTRCISSSSSARLPT